MESNDSSEIPDRGETSDIPGLPRPLWITSGLKENFKKRYIVERTNNAEIRPENRVKNSFFLKRRVARRIYGMKYSWKGHKDRNRHKNKKEWASLVGLCQA